MSDYLDLGGQRVWCAEYGTGEPVVLLHGGFVGADTWDPQIPALSNAYHVFTPERRGHGRTPDVDGPYTTENMAAETAAVIEAIAEGRAHIIGHSDGAYVAAYLALHRPELVDRLVLMGMSYSPAGETALARQLATTDVDPDWFRDDYARASPDGADHFPVVFDKVVTLWRNPIDIPLTDLARITAPTLILQGDDDGVRIQYSAAVARVLPDAQLAVVPGTGHLAHTQKADLVNRILLDFLRRDQPERLLALGALHEAP